MKIIRHNEKEERVSHMYGYSMRENSGKSIASPFIDTLLHKKATHIARVELESTNGCDEIKILYNDGRDESQIIRESVFKRTESELEMERNILSTFYEVSARHDIREIKCDDFLMEMKAKFKNDIRYAYKTMRTVSPRNSRHSVYIYYFYAIIIASVSILNSINFKMPIQISLEKRGAYLTMKIEMRFNNKLGLKKREEVIKAPENETKLLYLDMLCKNNNIENSFRLNDNKYILKYDFSEIEKEEIKLYSKESDEESFFLKYMDIFNGRGTGREEE